MVLIPNYDLPKRFKLDEKNLKQQLITVIAARRESPRNRNFESVSSIRSLTIPIIAAFSTEE